MERPTPLAPAPRTLEALVDEQDLRSVIAAAVNATPTDEDALRRGVWTYVGAERQAGTSPGRVIMLLTELIESAPMPTPADRPALVRRVILWCVEAYFGHLGSDVTGRGAASPDGPVLTLVR